MMEKEGLTGELAVTCDSTAVVGALSHLKQAILCSSHLYKFTRDTVLVLVLQPILPFPKQALSLEHSSLLSWYRCRWDRTAVSGDSPQPTSGVGRAGSGGAETRLRCSDWMRCVAETCSHCDWEGIWDFCIV